MRSSTAMPVCRAACWHSTKSASPGATWDTLTARHAAERPWAGPLPCSAPTAAPVALLPGRSWGPLAPLPRSPDGNASPEGATALGPTSLTVSAFWRITLCGVPSSVTASTSTWKARRDKARRGAVHHVTSGLGSAWDGTSGSVRTKHRSSGKRRSTPWSAACTSRLPPTAQRDARGDSAMYTHVHSQPCPRPRTHHWPRLHLGAPHGGWPEGPRRSGHGDLRTAAQL